MHVQARCEIYTQSILLLEPLRDTCQSDGERLNGAEGVLEI